MSAVTEQQINQIMEGLTDENFFQRVLALDSEDLDLAEACEAAQENLRNSVDKTSAKLLVGAAKGTLVWKLSGKVGRGSCSKTGAGGFGGKDLPPSVGPGSYTLVLTRFKSTLHLDSSPGNFIWNGTRVQKGVTGEWKGKFS